MDPKSLTSVREKRERDMSYSSPEEGLLVAGVDLDTAAGLLAKRCITE
jgi:hypothetical protein